MIVPNLMVSDMNRSLAFYCDLLGMEVEMSVDAQRGFAMGDLREGSVFVALKWNDAQLMLQTRESLVEEHPSFAEAPAPTVWGTVFFRGYDPETVVSQVTPDMIVKGRNVTWYGMDELTLRDPDGHVITLANPAAGAAPTG